MLTQTEPIMTCGMDNSSSGISVALEEGGCRAGNLTGRDDVIESLMLRKRIFCDELGWVEPRGEFETDKFDGFSVPFGVFNDGRLEAYLRLISTEHPFMLEEIFPMLIGRDHQLRKSPDTAEITRLCVDPSARKNSVEGNFGVYGISLFLYKSVYQWCVINQVRYLYLVVEYKIYRLLNAQGIICGKIGEPVTMPDGVKAVAAILDWREFEETNLRNRPRLAEWFMEFQSAHVPELQRLPDLSIRHPAFV